MAPELEKPYSLDDISKRPYAVTISLLIGLLLISVGYNLVVNTRADMKIDKVRAEMEKEKNDRISMYENMIFYKAKSERLEQGTDSVVDSVVRVKTSPFVNKIFKNGKK